MRQIIRKQVKIQSDGLMQIYVPECKPGTIAEVIVLELSEKKKKRSVTRSIGKGHGSIASSEERSRLNSRVLPSGLYISSDV